MADPVSDPSADRSVQASRDGRERESSTNRRPQSRTPDHGNGAATPTRVSAAVVLAASLGASVLLMTRVGPTLSMAIGLVDAALFAASLWLVDRERWRVGAFAVAGVLSLFVGASFVVAVGYTALQLVSTLFPVTDAAQIRSAGLRVVSVTAVVLGGTLSMIGGLAAVGNVLREETVWEYAKLSVKTFAVPLLIAAVMLLSALFGQIDDAAAGPLLAPLLGGIDAGVGALLEPTPGRSHALTFCLLFAVTALTVSRAVDALPIEELSTEQTDDRVEAAANAVRTRTAQAGTIAFFALPVGLLELAIEPEALEGVLTPPVYGALAAVTARHALRTALSWLLGLSLAVLAVTWALRRFSQTSSRDVALELTPFVGGAGVAGVVVVVHGTALPAAIDFVAERLPGAFATEFTRQSGAIVDFFGPLAVTMTLASVLVGLTAILSLGLAVVIGFGLLPEDVAAPALASGGTFLAAAFAGAVGVDPWLVFGGLVASLVAWDAGEYGITLGREVGLAGHTRGPEFVHVGATLAVGAASAVAAAGVYHVATDAGVGDLTVGGVTTLPFALAVAVVGLLLFVAALR